ncbi:MAG TPA: hypothetical protein VEX37_04025 [Thermomicrobiales bacterium]|nr:hypothetical protein [Thermomicrobiales bacterium]
MPAGDWFLVALRVAHALAAMLWLGGGVYYLLAVRPASRESAEPPRAFISATQGYFGEWAQVATMVMVVTGGILVFDRLSNGSAGLTYVALMAVKIVAALVAFWLAGVRPARRAARQGRRSAPETIVVLGLLAFAIGVGLSSVYGLSG